MPSRDESARIAALSADLRRAVGAFVRATRVRADSVPQSRAETLGELLRSGPQSIGALAASRGVAHQTASRMVAEMEAIGMVTREADPRDARAVLIDISEAGRNAIEADRRAREDRIAAAIGACVTTEERLALEDVPELLDRLAREISGRRSDVERGTDDPSHDR